MRGRLHVLQVVGVHYMVSAAQVADRGPCFTMPTTNQPRAPLYAIYCTFVHASDEAGVRALLTLPMAAQP